jgi:hypothetical protein
MPRRRCGNEDGDRWAVRTEEETIGQRGGFWLAVSGTAVSASSLLDALTMHESQRETATGSEVSSFRWS